MSLSSLNWIGQTVFELESRNKNGDGQTDGQTDQKQTSGQTNGQTNGRNVTNFESNLAMMVIYVPVKYELDWTNRSRVRVWKQKCGQTDGETNGQKTDKRTDRITQFRKEPSYDGDLCPCQV